jgi:hypothetical protein
MDIHQARTDVIQEEILAKMKDHQERMGASVKAWRKRDEGSPRSDEGLSNKDREQPGFNRSRNYDLPGRSGGHEFGEKS